MIISVHLPKTAGTSFLAALETHYGKALFKDYAGFGLNGIVDTSTLYEKYRGSLQASINLAEHDFTEIKCIHGHFFPIKYLLLRNKANAKFVTWMRNPVDRVLSHYFFWKESSDAFSSDLHRRVIEENWSLERFCLGPEHQNHYSEKLWAFPLEYFDFIGITEFYNEDFEYFSSHYLHRNMFPSRLRVGPNGGGEYRIERSFRDEIERFHFQDMELYNRALDMRRKRLGI